MTVLHPRDICGDTFVSHNDGRWLFFHLEKTSPYLSVGIHVGDRKPVYNDLSLEPVSHLKSTIYF